MRTRSGIGVDAHSFIQGGPLFLGGVKIPFGKGLLGHSDGDTLTHAVIDALLGGAGLGDIGFHFPSDKPEYKDISSIKLLKKTLHMLETNGWQTEFVDATIIAQYPALSPFITQMKNKLADSLRLSPEQVNLKSKTTDGLGFLGRGEGIAALVIATLKSVQ